MILRIPLCPAPLWSAGIVALAFVTGCGGAGARPPATPRDVPPAAAPGSPGNSIQGLYESGRYREVLNSGIGNAGPAALWFAAQSSLRLGEREEAARQFARLPAVGGSPTWQLVSELALARIEGEVGAIDRGRAAAAAFPGDLFVQFENGLAHFRRNDFAEAAQAFDRCTEADPRFAYAYYNAGLAYDRLNRTDLMVIRLETFLRLAPDAPERPEVEAILATTRR